jgi:hypothetical protein
MKRDYTMSNFLYNLDFEANEFEDTHSETIMPEA